MVVTSPKGFHSLAVSMMVQFMSHRFVDASIEMAIKRYRSSGDKPKESSERLSRATQNRSTDSWIFDRMYTMIRIDILLIIDGRGILIILGFVLHPDPRPTGTNTKKRKESKIKLKSPDYPGLYFIQRIASPPCDRLNYCRSVCPRRTQRQAGTSPAQFRQFNLGDSTGVDFALER